MDKRIQIQEVTETQDAYNQPVGTWTTYKTVWAEILWKPGREYFNAATEIATASAIFRIRYVTGVTRKMRVRYGGVNYDILSINEIGRKEGLEIIGEAVVE
jgi:SPP1 family predicted phage head-tail adaptor